MHVNKTRDGPTTQPILTLTLHCFRTGWSFIQQRPRWTSNLIPKRGNSTGEVVRHLIAPREFDTISSLKSSGEMGRLPLLTSRGYLEALYPKLITTHFLPIYHQISFASWSLFTSLKNARGISPPTLYHRFMASAELRGPGDQRERAVCSQSGIVHRRRYFSRRASLRSWHRSQATGV